ncbi:NAD(P)-dependent oxidoreductase [Leucobacter sp. NPDC077196]|uniref:NAD(P)-dependent oxidoreductase n=1 Tax=Leucobacter sp. NPDC077196 TaxID=3154959 RepID=UPI0034390636
MQPVRALSQVTSRLVQSPALGYDGIEALLPSGVTFANGVGVHETATAELAVTHVLTAQREMHRMYRDQLRRHWDCDNHFVPGLADREVFIVGYGGVGTEIARRLEPFGARISVFASRRQVAADGREVHSVTDLVEALPKAEVIVLAVPLTDRTRRLVDRDFLARMRDDALLVNLSRGPVAVTEDLVAEIGRLRFALDVTDPEPLPEDHPLWTAPGVTITPHAAAGSLAMRPRMLALIEEQVFRLHAGDEPLHVVIRT